MKVVGLFEAKTKLSELCSQVAKNREGIVVTRLGKPYVRIIPYELDKDSVWDARATYAASTLDDEWEDPILPERKAENGPESLDD